VHLPTRHGRRAARPPGAFPLAPQFAGEVQLILNDSRRVVFASASLDATLGYGLDEVVGDRLADLVHPDDQPTFDAAWSTAGADGDVELRLRHGDGSWRICVVRLRDLRDEIVQGVVVALHDVTATREAEEALQTRTARFHTLAEQLTEVVVTVDEELVVRTIGANVQHEFGHDPAALRGTPIVDLIHPTDRFATLIDLEELLGGEERTTTLARLQHAEGHWVPTSSSPTCASASTSPPSA
jgi:PAS domain S-box-containing protein